ncbi:hypothetical protein ACOJVU_00900 [Mycobacterium sp. THU-M104]|uniref:hypothetical protein n=1 Tax=Mycobacterium sp. THU-M104 TaxID=3410515 RepID=UPI003B9D37C9
MSGAHPDVGPELRRLAQAILDGIDPAVRLAAAMTAGGQGTGRCQQVWCPVCALAALATGEEHPLLTLIADHSVALLEVIRGIVGDGGDGGDGGRSPQPPPDRPRSGGEPPPGDATRAGRDAGEGTAKTRYQSIPVTVEE